MPFSILDIIWLLVIIWSFVPLFTRQTRDASRYKLIRQIEHKRKSRVITLIHRQESMNILGMTFARHIGIEDSEQLLRAIRITDPDVPIDIVLHTPGGLVLPPSRSPTPSRAIEARSQCSCRTMQCRAAL